MVSTFNKEEILKKIAKGNVYSIALSNKIDEPVYIVDMFVEYFLKINSDWLKDNFDEYEEFIIEYIKQTHNKKIIFDDAILVNENIVDAICANENIKEVSIAAGVKEDGYILTNDDYKKFKEADKEKIKTTGVSNDLRENFDTIISFNNERKLIGNKTYSDLQKDVLLLYNPLDLEELANLKYISDKTTLKLSSKVNIFDVQTKLEELNKSNKIIISLNYDTKNEELAQMGFFDEKWNVIKQPPDNMYVGENLKLSTYLRCENILYMIAREAEHLSPAEKYLYVYDISKHFKKYHTPGKDNAGLAKLPEDKLSKEQFNEIKMRSRDLYQILDNDYIVCVGFTAILVNLLEKLGIPAYQDSVSVELADYKAIAQLKNKYDNWNELSDFEKHELIMEQKKFIPQNTFEGHSRVVVRLFDPKYGIDGMYFSDPTWDNDLEENSYAHTFMTADTVSKSKSTLKFDCRDVFLYAASLEQFKDMFSIGLNKYIEDKRKEKYEQNKDTYASINETPVDIKVLITSYIRNVCVNSIKLIYPEEYELLINKYPFINDYDVSKWPFKSNTELGSEINDLLNEFGKFIISKNNNTISRDTLEKIIKETYRGIFFEPLSDDDIKAYNENPMDIGLNDKVYLSEVKQEYIDSFIKDTNDVEEYEFGEKITK